MTGAALRVVALADTDSYVKWAAAMLGSLPAGTDAELLIVETALVVSPAQQTTALARSGLDPSRVRRIGYEDLARVLGDLAPDAVLVAARGPVVRVLTALVATIDPRPVIVSGLPGISIPATTAAMVHRTQCDLFVLHSTREIAAFAALARQRGLTQRFALAGLPFARAAADERPSAERTDLVFASQAIVPRERVDRLRVARLLIETARENPDKRVVVKERATAGEHQTHAQQHGYPDLLRRMGPLPANLVVSTDSMAHALDTAEGLVTISSTAAVEAIARGIPVIALDTFGVEDGLINTVFVGSGLLGSEGDVVQRDFRLPPTAWLARNYFHDPAEEDWIAEMAQLVELRRAGELPPKPGRTRRGGRVRDVWERRLALGRRDRSVAGAIVWAVGVPARMILRPVLRPYYRRRLESV
ncbi:MULTISPECIES: DUF6716 putative glycosyltransferase [unclassified Microbacterium]|uniref:DUF6716 putative glycosyltransferase n=1 Tax=unclassified Microbacterium TaxID=2609290 RepID=UPI000C2CBB4E|nr:MULTISPECIES: DUF6716 putative glycosyltransferase [unclassified Microbacterium]